MNFEVDLICSDPYPLLSLHFGINDVYDLILQLCNLRYVLCTCRVCIVSSLSSLCLVAKHCCEVYFSKLQLADISFADSYNEVQLGFFLCLSTYVLEKREGHLLLQARRDLLCHYTKLNCEQFRRTIRVQEKSHHSPK